MPIRLALVNDYEVVVRGLADMLRSYRDDFEIVELDVAVPVKSRVDVALYDTFAQAQGDSPKVSELVANPNVDRLVVYTWNLDEALVRASIDHGVSGYLSKALTAAQLADALKDVAAGRTVVSPDPGRVSAVLSGDWPGREEGLSAREAEVLALITQGLSNLEVAERTSLSINSIKSHIRSCYRKIGVTSRSQAVIWGVRHGFLPGQLRESGRDA